MKSKIFFLSLLAMGVMACGETPNEPEKQPEKLSHEELTARIKDYAQYLSDNYEKGDTVCFLTEAGEKNVLIVSASTLTCGPITSLGDDDEDPITEYVYGSYLYMQKASGGVGGPTFIGSVLLDEYGMALKRWVMTYKRDVASDAPRLEAPQPAEDELLLTSEKGWCLLKRNVGIVQVADTAGRTWTLIQ